MDDSFKEHMAQIRAHRAELGESMHALEDALAGPLGLDVWGRRVRAALTELAHDVREHIELLEGPGGLYSDIATTAPRLSNTVDALLADHVYFTDEIERLLQARDDGISRADLDQHRDELTALLQRLVRHRQRGSDMVYEAYTVDIGGSD